MIHKNYTTPYGFSGAQDAELPYGLQLVDTPGMIDLPGAPREPLVFTGFEWVFNGF
jgi:hypothetical protein